MKKSFTLESLLEKMAAGDFVLPEIQREFVWDMNRIIEFWDSIYRGYPIGQLLFWEAKTNVPLYSFIDDNEENEYLFVAKRPKWVHRTRIFNEGKTIVLDGQQRLTSLFLGAYQNGITVKTRKNSQPSRRFLCIYIHDIPEENVGNIKLFDWRKEEESADYISVAKALASRKQSANIRILKERLRANEFAVPVDYVMVDNLDAVVEIFRRLNTNGRSMSKSELFLAMWFGSKNAEGLKNDLVELREAFADFDVQDNTITLILKSIFGSKDDLNDLNYNDKIFSDISKNIPRLKKAIKLTVNFLQKECGIYSDTEMVTHGLFVPLVHIFYRFKSRLSLRFKEELRCFVYRALLFDLFSKSTNTTLQRMRKTILDLSGPDDSLFHKLHETIKIEVFNDYFNNKSEWLRAKVADLLMTKKGAKTNLALLLLKKDKANVDGDMYDQDHLVAADLFNYIDINALKYDPYGKFGILVNKEISAERALTDDELREWEKIAKRNIDKCDTLPNLWLLESSRNRKKGKKLLNIWYMEQDEKSKNDFWREIYLPKHAENYLKITNFEKIYEDRKKALSDSLLELLKYPQ